MYIYCIQLLSRSAFIAAGGPFKTFNVEDISKKFWRIWIREFLTPLWCSDVRLVLYPNGQIEIPQCNTCLARFQYLSLFANTNGMYVRAAFQKFLISLFGVQILGPCRYRKVCML